MRGLFLTALLLACAPVQPAAHSAAVATPKTQDCAAFVVGQMGPRCIRPLSPAEQKQRNFYRLRFEADRVVRVERLTGSGAPNADDDGEIEYRYTYVAGKRFESYGVTQHGTISVRRHLQASREVVLDEWNRPKLRREQEAVGSDIEFDERGFEREARFFGLDGKPARTSNGAYRWRRENDERGLTLRSCWYDAEGRPMLTRWGVHCLTALHDEFGNERETRFFDTAGQPVENVYGLHRAVNRIDGFGRVVAAEWFGKDGLPLKAPLGRCSALRWAHEGGRRTGALCLDAEGNPAPFREGNAYWRESVDARGDATELRYFNIHGELVVSGSSARIAYTRDPKGYELSRRFFLASGVPGQRNGPAEVRYGRLPNGLVNREDYFDGSGERSEDDGCATRTWGYDSFRQATSRSCLDNEGNSVPDDDGITIIHWAYDPANGLVQSESYFDKDNKPVNSQNGYSVMRYVYTAQGTEIRRDLFAADGARVTLPRYRSISLRVPYSSRGFNTGSREAMLTRALEARRALLAGESFESVAIRFGHFDVSSKTPGYESYQDTSLWYANLRLGVRGLAVGEISEVMEIPDFFRIFQRIE